MPRLISDDGLGRALSVIAPQPDAKYRAQQAQVAAAMRWIQEQLKHSVARATATARILDCDTII